MGTCTCRDPVPCDGWGACSIGKKKLWFNLQLAQKPYACLDYIILHELTHLITRKHDATFIAHMDKCMPNWREIRKELNDSRLDYYEAQDESPLQKLIDQSRYDDIRDATIAYIQEERSGDTKRLSVVDMEIENVIHIEQPEDGVIAFDVIASCDVEMPSASHKGYFNERWLKIHCQATLGIDMSGFRIMSVDNCEPQEESDNDRLSGELVPIISRDQFEDEAEKFLTRYCPDALDKPMRIPIETIASDMKLHVIEDVPLSDDLTYFGTIIFDNGNVLDKHRKITIRNAKRGTVYLDPRVSYERSVGTKRTTLAHECFHWHRHQPYHVLMKMIGAIRMNTWIAKKNKWTLAELEERSEYLMGRALSIWAAPVTEYKPEEKQLDTYTLEDEGELTGRLIAKFTFKNTEQPVTSWVEMFQKVIQILYAEDKAIITKLAMSEEENIALHFNTNPDAFTKSVEIGDGIYVWTNTSTQSKLSVLSCLFKLYNEDPSDLVFYLRDENEANEDEPGSRYELRRKYWTCALPIIQKAHGEDGSFSNVNPSRDNWINGSFGIGGFYLCCVANYQAKFVMGLPFNQYMDSFPDEKGGLWSVVREVLSTDINIPSLREKYKDTKRVLIRHE